MEGKGQASKPALPSLVPVPSLPKLLDSLLPPSHSLLVNGLQELQGRFNLLFGLGSLHCGAGDGDVLALSSHVVCVGDHAHVDVYPQKGLINSGIQRAPGG